MTKSSGTPSSVWNHASEGQSSSLSSQSLRATIEALDLVLGSGAGAADPKRYELLREIGHGGMGVVYEARDRLLRRPVALKFAYGPLDKARQARFLREALITGQLQHPGIVPVHEIGEIDGRKFLAMTLVSGERLDDVFRCVHTGTGGWTQARALHVLIRVCETLAYAHQRRVIHRDLKPQNVMVGEFGETFVMDWGLALYLDEKMEKSSSVELGGPLDLVPDTADLTRAGGVLGSPSYVAPEQAAGRRAEVGKRTDVYSLGAMLYSLLAGQEPYKNEPTTQNPFHAVVAGPPRPLRELAPRVAPELDAICARAMAREPSQRYATMLELRDDLRAFVEGRVVSAHRVGLLAELEKWLSRNRVVAAWMVATAASIVFGLGLLAWFQARGRRADFLAADALRLPALVREAEELWPTILERTSDMELWLERAHSLYERREIHDARWRDLRARFADRELDAEERRELLTREDLSRDIELLPNLSAWIGERLAFARTVSKRSLEQPDVAHRWREACASIADQTECPAYRGLRIAPQFGLVPLGRDPNSGLWEFAHLETGTEPRRGREGRLEYAEDCGLVFVLVPPGRFWMGAQAQSYFEENPDLASYIWEEPPNEVSLEAFFLSKFEMTQGQWRRATKASPSVYRGELHPVESVSWRDCHRTLARLGLCLPTEAQWEYSARAGTHTVYWTGDDYRTLGQYCAANLMDTSGWEGFDDQRTIARDLVDWLDDGHAVHAPVGSFAPNPFGLHDTHGNVWEWCADLLTPYEYSPREGDGLRCEHALGQQPALRGGSFRNAYSAQRVSLRENNMPEVSASYIGVRPARRVDP